MPIDYRVSQDVRADPRRRQHGLRPGRVRAPSECARARRGRPCTGSTSRSRRPTSACALRVGPCARRRRSRPQAAALDVLKVRATGATRPRGREASASRGAGERVDMVEEERWFPWFRPLAREQPALLLSLSQWNAVIDAGGARRAREPFPIWVPPLERPQTRVHAAGHTSRSGSPIATRIAGLERQERAERTTTTARADSVVTHPISCELTVPNTGGRAVLVISRRQVASVCEQHVRVPVSVY